MSGGWVYIMSDKPRGTLYVGVTGDLARRIWQHRTGDGGAFSKRYGLERLVYVERHDSIRTALQREKLIKHWKRSWKMELIRSINPEWRDLYETII